MKKHKKRILTLAALFGTATVIIYIVNKMIAASACVMGLLDRSIKNCYHWRLGNIYYRKKGEGKPILLIHDMFPGSSGYEWKGIEDELAKSRTVYTLDLIGCGRSEKQGMIYTNYIFVQLITDFVNDIIGEKTDVLVSGYSSSFVVMANLNDKDLFHKIAMINPPSLSSLRQMPETKDRVLKKIIEIPVFGTLIYHMVVSREAVTNFYIEKLVYDPFHLDEDQVDAYIEAAHRGGRYAKSVFASHISKFMNISIDKGLENLEIPALIIEGEQEKNGKAIAADYKGFQSAIDVVTMQGTKHLPHIEEPEKFMEIANEFFVE